MRRILYGLRAILLLWLLPCILSGCRKHGEIREAESEPSFEERAEAWADSILQRLSPEEMAGQLVLPAVYSRLEDSDEELLRFYADSLHVGGILLLQGDAESAAAIADMMSRHCGVEPWVAIDAEWGLGMRLADAPLFPRNSRISDKTGLQVLYEYGEELARECRAVGINMVLGPVADISEKGGIMESRSFGDDPQQVADMMTAYSQGLESGGVVSVAKHFPGHGRDIGDSHTFTPEIRISLDSLENTDLYPFRRYADAGLSGIMAGHIAVPALDPSGRPASVSEAMLSGVLREDMDFKGLILTDALNMGGANGWLSADAIEAGADMVLAPASTREEIREILRCMDKSEDMRQKVRERCRRVLLFKYLFRVAGSERRKRAVNHQRTLKEVLYFGADSLLRRLSP